MSEKNLPPNWADTAWPDFSDDPAGIIAVLPLAATEQHVRRHCRVVAVRHARRAVLATGNPSRHSWWRDRDFNHAGETSRACAHRQARIVCVTGDRFRLRLQVAEHDAAGAVRVGDAG